MVAIDVVGVGVIIVTFHIRVITITVITIGVVVWQLFMQATVTFRPHSESTLLLQRETSGRLVTRIDVPYPKHQYSLSN